LETIELGFTKTTPNLWSINGFHKHSSPINTDDMLDQDVNCVTVRLSLLVTLECFPAETRVDCNVGDLRYIVIVEFLNVMRNSTGAGSGFIAEAIKRFCKC